MHLCIADIAMFMSVLFLGSGVCVETKNIDVFVASIRPECKTRQDERIARTQIKYKETQTACWIVAPYFNLCESNEHRGNAKHLRVGSYCQSHRSVL